jgi:hypothetical protein
VRRGLADGLGEVRSFRVRVRPALADELHTRGTRGRRGLPPEAVTQLLESAEHLGEGALADALRALAKAGAAKG